MPDPQGLVCDVDNPLPMGTEIPVSVRVLEARFIAGAIVLEGSLYRVWMIETRCHQEVYGSRRRAIDMDAVSLVIFNVIEPKLIDELPVPT
jgi:hypothetical protein